VRNSQPLAIRFLRSPILWGGLATAAFYGLIRMGVIGGALVDRYLLSHPVEYVATALFFIGLAVLGLKAVDVLRQSTLVGRVLLGSPPAQGERPAGCDVLLARLDDVSDSHQDDYLIRRLRELLRFVRARQSAESLDEQMQVLSETDTTRAEEGYALCNLITALIPVLGFLGTVIGITGALGHLAPDQLEQSLPRVMDGLYVAFDTTALALALTSLLMFVRFFVSQAERRLIEQVDRHVAVELEDRFIATGVKTVEGRDEIRQLAQRVFDNADRLVERQAQLWHQSMDAAGVRWSQMARAAGEQIRDVLGSALAEGLRSHAREITTAHQSLADQNRQHWNEIQKTQVQNTHSLASLQASLSHQAEVLERAIAAAGQVSTLEDALNRNLTQLRGANHFEQTAVSLAAAVQLLAARLGEPDLPDRIRLSGDETDQQAA